jgi:two-component system OmpR family sensor kinase/two-component system sensor histidine kinase BaeS
MSVFLGVIVVGVIVMVVSVRLSTAAQLRRRVLSDDVAQANALVVLLAGYYSQNGSWSRVESYLASGPQVQNTPQVGMGPGMMGPGMMRNWGDWMGVTRTTGPLADRVVLLDSTGRVIADTGQASLGDQHPPQHTEDGVQIIVNGETVGTVLAGSMIEPVLNPTDEDFLHSVNLSIMLTSAIVGLLALVLGSLLFRQITSPLRALSQSAQAIADGDLRQRVVIQSNDEIGRVARSFNRMAESLAQADVQRRNLIADVAHELRTPLTVIQGNLEALMDGVYDLTPESVAAVHKQTVVLTRLVADLRDLALAESGQLRLELKTIYLADVITQASEGLEIQAHEKGVTLKHEVAGNLPEIQADEQRITQVLYNLMSNALRHTPAGGTITTTAELRMGVLVSVRDTGTGIAPRTYRTSSNVSIAPTASRPHYWWFGARVNHQQADHRGTWRPDLGAKLVGRRLYIRFQSAIISPSLPSTRLPRPAHLSPVWASDRKRLAVVCLLWNRVERMMKCSSLHVSVENVPPLKFYCLLDLHV